jgi:3-hydroxyacyl-[acyl-carrier-protein] dehydratase
MTPPVTKLPLVDFSEFSLDTVVADKAAVFEFNPHRFELALLDGILLIDEKRAVGYYDVPAEPFWARGHFPGRPMMPGVLITEVAAQLTSYLATNSGIRGNAIIGLAGLNDIRFRAQIVPGDRLIVMVLTKKSRKGAMIVTDFQVYVGQTLAAEGEIKGIAIDSKE